MDGDEKKDPKKRRSLQAEVKYLFFSFFFFFFSFSTGTYLCTEVSLFIIIHAPKHEINKNKTILLI